MIGPVYWMKRQMMKRGQTVDEPRTALSENIDCLLTFQGNAHPWGKNALIFAVKYHQVANGCAAQDWGQLLTLRVKTCSPFTSFTSNSP